MTNQSHGTGNLHRNMFAKLGNGVVFEPHVLVFHPENIEIEDDVYVGHQTILKGYYRNKMIIGQGTWIGQQCFFHSAGGITIGKHVGIGPAVKIITSFHAEEGIQKPILHSHIEFAPVIVEDDCDIGTGAIILPGVKVERGGQIGAGAVVTKSLPPYVVAAGNPAKIIKTRQPL